MFQASLTAMAPVVQTLDSAIHWINHYPVDEYWGNQLLYPLDRFLSCGERYIQRLNNRGQEVYKFLNTLIKTYQLKTPLKLIVEKYLKNTPLTLIKTYLTKQVKTVFKSSL